MKQRKPLVVGNWKMNGDIVANDHLFTALRAGFEQPLLAQVEVAVCPPYPYLGQAAAWLGDTAIAWGAQDVAAFDNGAFTGEVSAAMLADLGCKWAIVGHSERRTLLGETDGVLVDKAEHALARGLGVIVCVGETLEQRERDQTDAVLGTQVDALARIASRLGAARFVLAYEPVWAIGTGRTATPEQAQAAHAFLRARLRAAGVAESSAVRILYGGSVKPANAASLFRQPDIDGGLIGGAALVAEDFVAIARARRSLEGISMNILLSLIIVAQVLSALGVIVLVLLQHGKGADMGAAFGSGASGSLFGATGSANFLSRMTGVLAAVFFVSTLAISVMTAKTGTVAAPKSVMEQGLRPAPRARRPVPRQSPAPLPPQRVPLRPLLVLRRAGARAAAGAAAPADAASQKATRSNEIPK